MEQNPLNPVGAAGDMYVILPLYGALLLCLSATSALCLLGYFQVNLIDLSDDLVNPITLCNSRINPKLKFELGLHAVSILVWLAAWKPFGLALALPCFVLRLKWHKSLHLDATTIFKESTQREVRWRWTVM